MVRYGMVCAITCVLVFGFLQQLLRCLLRLLTEKDQTASRYCDQS